MKITFFSNFLNHHQLPFCQEMRKILGNDFVFVATEPVEKERLAMGYKDMSLLYDFSINSYQDEDSYEKALYLGYHSDIVIIGSAPEIFIRKRLAEDKITLKYRERVMKRGIWQAFDPRVIWYMWESYARYKNKRVYLLCASAYTACDMNLYGAFPNKMYKWGYFPEVKKYAIDDLLNEKEKRKEIYILWVGRLLKWKHPEYAIIVAEYLKKKEIHFKLDIIGEGEMESKLKEKIKKKDLEQEITMRGFTQPENVRKYMEQANIFLFTSDYQEGWGAVLNESMNSGCTVIASHAIGSVPFLIKNGENGLIYKNGDNNDLCKKAEIAAKSKNLRLQMGKAAYQTLTEIWNARNAAENIVCLSERLIKNQDYEVKEGPVSKAEVIPQRKMYRYVVKEKSDGR